MARTSSPAHSAASPSAESAAHLASAHRGEERVLRRAPGGLAVAGAGERDHLGAEGLRPELRVDAVRTPERRPRLAERAHRFLERPARELGLAELDHDPTT
jgi:hypothetical protein